MTCSAPRFSEPRDFDANIWRIWTPNYKLGAVVFAKARAYDEFVDFDDVNEQTYWLVYEIEQLKGCEPEILSIKVEGYSKNKAYGQIQVAPAFLEVAEQYLRDDHTRWADMRKWLEENGERDPIKELEAA